jgi:hypothetical protein
MIKYLILSIISFNLFAQDAGSPANDPPLNAVEQMERVELFGGNFVLSLTTHAVMTEDLPLIFPASKGMAGEVLLLDNPATGQLSWGSAGSPTSIRSAAGTTIVHTDRTLGENFIRMSTNSVDRLTIDSSGGVGIGTATINSSALLQLNSVSKGLLPTRMTTVQRDAIAAPAAGLTVYNTTDNRLQTYNGTDWTGIASGSEVRGEGTTEVDSFPLWNSTTSDLIKGQTILRYDETDSAIKIGGFDNDVWPSAIFEIVSSNKGFLPPRMTETQRNAIANKAAGMIVYNTTNNRLETYNGATWNSFSTYLERPTTTTVNSFPFWTVNNGHELGNQSLLNYDPVNLGIVVGSGVADSSSLLTINSSSKGFLPPRLTNSERNTITTPAEGLLIWNTTDSELQSFDGTNWDTVGGTTVGLPTSSTNNSLVVWDGTTGDTIKDSTKDINDVVINTGASTDDHIAVFSGTTGSIITNSTKDIDDIVVGPATATNINIPMFNGTTGKLISDSTWSINDLIARPISTPAARSVAIYTNQQQLDNQGDIFIDTGGDLGVGTSTPSGAFNVKGESNLDGFLRVREAADTGDYIHLVRGSNAQIYTEGSGELEIADGTPGRSGKFVISQSAPEFSFWGDDQGTLWGGHAVGQLSIINSDTTSNDHDNAAITGYYSNTAGTGVTAQLWYIGSSSSTTANILVLNRESEVSDMSSGGSNWLRAAGASGSNANTVGGGRAYTNYSDIRIKKNIESLESTLDKVLQLQPKRYERRDDIFGSPGRKYLGFIAQDIEPLFPEIVRELEMPFTPEGLPSIPASQFDGDLGTPENPVQVKSMTYQMMIPVLVKALQEMNDKVESLKLEIEALK